MSLEDDSPLSEGRVCGTGTGLVAAACLLAFGIGLAGFFIGQHVEGGLSHLHAPRLVAVKGLAERSVKADLALWPLRFVATGDDLGAVQARIDADTKTMTAFLKSEGVPESAFTVERTDVVDKQANRYGSERPDGNRFILYGNMMIRTTDVDLIQRLSGKMQDVVKAGVILTQDGAEGNDRASLAPFYLFTRLNDIKLDMLAEATHNARSAAEQFARDAAVPLGGIVTANQGVFSILPGDSYPMAREETQPNKVVRVVSSVSYALAD